MSSALTHPAKNHGFTLVELSVVLVVLGLLIGGIMGGQSLLRRSDLQSVISDYTKYSSAVEQFRQQYGNLPGDMNDATNVWGDDATAVTGCADAAITDGTPGTCNGDGDGNMSEDGEPFRAWQQLVLANLIKGYYSGIASSNNPVLGTNVPKSRIANAGWNFAYKATTSGNADYYDQDLNNYLSLGAVITNNPIMQGAALTPAEAWQIDKKIDNGLPATGRVMALKPSPSTINPSCTTSATDASAAYTLTGSTNACSLAMSLTSK